MDLDVFGRLRLLKRLFSSFPFYACWGEVPAILQLDGEAGAPKVPHLLWIFGRGGIRWEHFRTLYWVSHDGMYARNAGVSYDGMCARDARDAGVPAQLVVHFGAFSTLTSQRRQDERQQRLDTFICNLSCTASAATNFTIAASGVAHPLDAGQAQSQLLHYHVP